MQYRRDSRVRSARSAGESLAQWQPVDQGGVGGRAAAGVAGGAGHCAGRGAHLRLRGPLQRVTPASSLARTLTWVSHTHFNNNY